MFHFLKQPGRLVHFFNFLLLKNQRLTNAIRPYCYFVNYSSQIALCGVGQNKGFLTSNDQSRLTLSRGKHSKKKKRARPRDEESSDEEDSDEDVDDDDDDVGQGDSVKTYNVKSLRIDGVLKTLLRTSRKNIEMKFYENRIRVNGEKIHKKSQNVKLNDVIEVIKSTGGGSNTLIVGQIKIQKIEPDPDAGIVLIKAWICKAVEVENYEGTHAWRDQHQEEDSL